MTTHLRYWLWLFIATWAGAADAVQVITEPFLGVRLIHQTETSPRPLNIYVAEIDLSAPGIQFMVTPWTPGQPRPTINGQEAETMRQTTSQFVNGIGAQLGINAAYYATETPATLWANNVGLIASNGNHYSPWEASNEPNFRNALNITQNNEASIIKRASPQITGYETIPANVPLYNAVTGSNRLVENGINVVVPGCTFCAQNPRTAIGLTAGNAKLLLMTVDGRQTGFSEGLTMPEMANYLISYGAVDAIDMDGGGSTTFVTDYYGDSMNAKALNKPSDGSDRAVASNLAVFALPNGDYNQNGVVDAADYVVWRKSIGGQPAYDAWRSKFGSSPSGLGSGASVPEPSAIALFALAFSCLWALEGI